MRQSARRIRTLYIRYALAEIAAFPGIRTEWPSFPYNEERPVECRRSHPHPPQHS